MDLGRLIEEGRGDRSFKQLSDALGGRIPAGTIHRLATTEHKNAADPPTINALADALGVPVRTVWLAQGESLGLPVWRDDTEQVLGMLPAGIQHITARRWAILRPLKSWGKTNKGLLGFIAEHVCVVEDRLHLGVTEPTGITQRFVHTFRGSGIQYEEYVADAVIDFTVLADWDFADEQWAMIWLTGEQQGIGATRSQGFGRYTVTHWAPAVG